MTTLLIVYGLFASCSISRRIDKSQAGVSLSIPESSAEEEDEDVDVVMDSIRKNAPNDPLLMKAIRETASGQMYATDIISASEVVAKFKNVAERNGVITLAFDIKVPKDMIDSRWQLKFYPRLEMVSGNKSLDPVFITGRKYREQQLRGYQRYQKFIDSIILDSAYFIRKEPLEIFIRRNFPKIWELKTDSTFVDETQGTWGVTKEEVVKHYTRSALKAKHRKKWEHRDDWFRKYVKDPLPFEGVRLDSVITDASNLVYSYSQALKVDRGVRKIFLLLDGELYENGKNVKKIGSKDTLEYYVTSLSSLMDKIERKKMKIVYRKVSDSTKAFINFKSASSFLDSSYLDNASELARIGRSIDAIASLKEMVLDSLVITASCSPEGAYTYNSRLSKRRSESIKDFIGRYLPDSLKGRVRASYIPENWIGLCKRIESDTALSPNRKNILLSMAMNYKEAPDKVEKNLSEQVEYPYLRKKIYPALRAVMFDFHLHRPNMQKDTVHTSEIDSVYMNGLESMRNMDYKGAVARLRPYKDYNAALSCVLADYNHSALEILKELEEDARNCYLKAIIYSRLGFYKEAVAFLNKSIDLEPTMKFRAGLDPELSSLTKNIN